MNLLNSLIKKLTVIQEYNDNLNKKHTAKYIKPSIDILKEYKNKDVAKNIDPMILEEKLSEFGFESCVENVSVGPLVTRYEIKLAKGVKLSQVKKVSEDIALALMSESIRIEAPIPGTSLIGIEIPNTKSTIIGLKDILSKSSNDMCLPISLGVDIVGKPKIIDMVKMPHLLIAGTTGSGKSVCMNSIILSVLFNKTPEECQLVLVDPKRVEMASYKNIPHLRCPVVTEPEDATLVFQSLLEEMDRRYKLLEDNRVRNIQSYNKIVKIKLPYIIALVDEMADLMMTSSKALEPIIVRLAQLARAVGIHLVLATQKPIVKVITGLIKSNMPSRISFQVSSKNDSRVILDCNGAEKLLGRGDMLMLCPGMAEPERYHGAWVSDEEINAVVDSIK